MNEKAHRLTTRLALEVAATLQAGIWSGRPAEKIIAEAAQTDYYQDLEFVGVKAGLDNPHDPQPRPAADQAHTLTDQRSNTAFNHFLDIRKGQGAFDDYDGYSYYRGSAHREQYQRAQEVSSGWGRLAADLTGFKVDEGIAYWLNDEYVHAPGQAWYQRCSPAAERYSFFRDRQLYGSARAEALARFPLANDPGEPDRGIPYSVFFPVDNLARYWFGRFLKFPGQVKSLGPVMHALQDASIPHHAAGCMGNWHVEYENALDEFAQSQMGAPGFGQEVRTLVQRWLRRPAGRAPAPLTLRHRQLVPNLAWQVEDTVTWLALQSYFEYVHTYGQFKRGWQIHAESLKRLVALAAGASALVLIKARKKGRMPRRK
jgi:hypothetical protein